MSEGHDVEKGIAENKSAKLENLSSEDPDLAKAQDLPAIEAAPADGDKVLEIVARSQSGSSRGRSSSRGSTSSNDSENSHRSRWHDHQTPPHRDRSRAQSSTRSIRRDAVQVPRSERRGLFAQFTVVAEVTNPYDYTRSKKWWITFVIAIAGAAAPMASSIVLPALIDIAQDFDTTATVVNLSVSLYMISMSIFPLWWSSFSETLGRRTVYIASFTLYVIFSILGAISTTVGFFLAMRLLSGGAAASVQAVGAGSIADIWEVKERGRAMGIFYLGPLCGPLLSPIIGGVLAEYLGWRACQWFLAIMGVVILVLIFFCLPETLKERKNVAVIEQAEEAEDPSTNEKGNDTARPTLTRTTTRQSVAKVRTKKYLTALRRCFIDPLLIMRYLQFPAVAILVSYATVVFCALYSLNISIQQTFSAKPYNYTPIIVGLLYLPNSLGYFLTSIFGGRWIDVIMRRKAESEGRYDEKGKLQFQPEDRIGMNAWVGGTVFPASLIMYGWTVQYGVSVAAPLVAGFFFGCGSMLIFAMATTMLTEFMPRKASNGVALNNFVRNVFSCIGSAVTEPLIVAIGNGWLFTIFGIISLISGFVAIMAMKRYGEKWRTVMNEKMDRVMGD